mmetsp:Transcript_17067/g.27728  ORF Transcript_17067/g.27728 Transcript_17067/m.27728 type:complete len:118 (-) Transcript_17067:90-443(-)
MSHGGPSNGVHLEDFCGDCDWKDGMTCGKRSTYLNKKFGPVMTDAMAVVMDDTKKGTNSFYEEEIQKLGGFCGRCRWGTNATQTYHAQVVHLTCTYRNPVPVAQLVAMEKPSCRLNK